MPMNNHAVCIAGMPRSGTSLIAHAAKLAGVYLGRDEALMPAMANMNDEGFFELEDFLLLQRSILVSAGQAGWSSSSPLPDQWWRDPSIRAGRDALAALVVREFAMVPRWGWKSPPSTILLPLWEDLAQELGFSLRMLVVFRNPLDVARSLARVWNLPISQGLRLWVYYMLTVMEVVKRHPHLFIQYDDFLENPEAGAQRLGEFLGCNEIDLPQKVRAIVRPGLRHGRSRLEELAAVADPDLVALYQECLDCAAGTASAAIPPAPRLFASLGDYRRWSQLVEAWGSDLSPICLDSAVIVDNGDGKDHVVAKIIPYAPDGCFDEEFRLPIRNAQTVLFCPCPGGGQHFFRCQVEGIGTDGVSQGIECKNPEKEENGWDVFSPGGKPFYKLKGDFSQATYVRIKGRIEVATPVPLPPP